MVELPATIARDLSPWGMFMSADIVVKTIMVGLMFASFVTWVTWLAKSWELRAAKKPARNGIHVLQEAKTLADASERFEDDPRAIARFVQTAQAELVTSDIADGRALKERISWLLERLEAGASRHISRGMGVLASIGATAPFVGLLGTAWGIMNSFIGISNTHTTNLAVVAPGIAEALLATALGLVAAIPAVIIYNHFARVTKDYLELVGRASGASARLLSRDLDRTHVGGAQSRAAE